MYGFQQGQVVLVVTSLSTPSSKESWSSSFNRYMIHIYSNQEWDLEKRHIPHVWPSSDATPKPCAAFYLLVDRCALASRESHMARPATVPGRADQRRGDLACHVTPVSSRDQKSVWLQYWIHQSQRIFYPRTSGITFGAMLSWSIVNAGLHAKRFLVISCRTTPSRDVMGGCHFHGCRFSRSLKLTTDKHIDKSPHVVHTLRKLVRRPIRPCLNGTCTEYWSTNPWPR